MRRGMPPVSNWASAPAVAKIPVSTTNAGRSIIMQRTRTPAGMVHNLVEQGIIRVAGTSWGPWSVTLLPLVAWLSGRPLCAVSWGAGDVRSRAEFDWPFLGGSFVINAEAFEVAVRPTVADLDAAYAEPGAVAPVAGAFAVPGSGIGTPEPCIRLAENGTGSGTLIAPPHARYLVVSPFALTAIPLVAGRVWVRFAGPTADRYSYATKEYQGGATQEGPFRLRVPPQADRAYVYNDVAPYFSAYWEIALA